MDTGEKSFPIRSRPTDRKKTYPRSSIIPGLLCKYFLVVLPRVNGDKFLSGTLGFSNLCLGSASKQEADINFRETGEKLGARLLRNFREVCRIAGKKLLHLFRKFFARQASVIIQVETLVALLPKAGRNRIAETLDNFHNIGSGRPGRSPLTTTR